MIKRRLEPADWLMAGVAALWLFGLVMLSSIDWHFMDGVGLGGRAWHLVARQLAWGGLGLVPGWHPHRSKTTAGCWSANTEVRQ